jgi:fructoselysine-6-P-deglycase FrlB-like protein
MEDRMSACEKCGECDRCVASLRAQLKAAREALAKIDEARKRHGHNDTCSYSVGGSDYACDCGAHISERALAALDEEGTT